MMTQNPIQYPETPEGRFEAAKAEARRVNYHLQRGLMAIDTERNHPFIGSFEITDKQVLQRVAPRCTYVWHNFDPECDDGSHTPVADIVAMFRRIKFYQEVQIPEGFVY